MTLAPGRRKAPKPRVLLLDEGFMSGAYTAVGLQEAGCDVVVLAATGGRGGHAANDITWSLAPAVGSDALLDVVDATLRESEFDYVYPVTEPIQEQLSNAAAQWSAKVLPRTEPWQRELLSDKYVLAQHVGDRGVPVPAQLPLTCGADAQVAAGALGLPLVVKGARGRGGSTTYIASSLMEVHAAARAIVRDRSTCFAQQYVDGPTYLVGGLFDDGCPIRIYAGRKLEQYPPRTGPAICMRSVDDPRLLESALTVFRALRWTGLASVDFIGADGGRYLFLELNPRPWGSITAAAEAGVDLFGPFVEMLRGRRPAPDLTFRPDVESTVFPLYLLSRARWRMGRALGDAASDLLGPNGMPWRSPGQAVHLLHRLYRVGRNWPRRGST